MTSDNPAPDTLQGEAPAYQVSARRYRPQAFDQVVGQPHIVRTLTNAITSGRIAHAYLFSGVRGVGKTTVARVFAKALVCSEGPTPTPCNTCELCRAVTAGTAPDVMEIDGASNNSVDDIRDLSDNIRYRPLAARYRIYIIDEVHMLSQSAFNALLKTLEEPPAHAVFIFATTETHKIPQTILSRCQHHAFRRLSREEIVAQLDQVAAGEGITASRSAVALLARAADGSLRDALSLFDQAVSFGGGALDEADVTLMLGVAGQATLTAFAADLLAGDAGAALGRLRDLTAAGQDLQILAAQLVEHFRNLLVCRVTDAPGELIDLSDDDVAELAAQANEAPREVLEQVLHLLAEAQERARRAAAPRFLLEAALVRACEAPRLADLADLAARLDALAGGAPAPSGAPSAPPRPRPQAAPAPPPRAPSPGPAAAPPQAPPRAMEAGASVPPPAPPRPAPSAPPPAAAAPAPAPEPEPEPYLVDSAPEAEAAPAPAPAGPPPAPAELWPAVVRLIRRGRPALASYLEQGAVQAVSRNRVEVGFLPAYEVMLSMVGRPENREFVAEVAREVAGHPVEVAFATIADAPASEVTTLAQEFEAQEAAAHRQDVERTMELPFIRDVLDTFGGEIVELRKPESEH
jgi:DNA polymerase-3 subunit gamma/tau